MPGPAPPSASYLLKIVDSSEEEDEESDDEEMAPLNFQEQHKQQQQDAFGIQDDDDMPFFDAQVEESPTPAHPRSDSVASMASSTTSTSPPKKKKKKKKNKKKKKKGTDAGTATMETANMELQDETSPSPNNNKGVSFGSVSVQAFERCLGPDVVPYDGGWPLGLGEAVGSRESIPIEDYETNKQERLRIRAQEKGIDATTTSVLETRQWDYKHKTKNPLFHLLQEDQRMELLLLESTPLEDEDAASMNGSSHHNHHHSPTKRTSTSSSGSSSPSSSSKRRDSKNKRRDSKNNKNTPGPASNTRSRSGSFSQQERYNETYTQVAVHHVRNELEELRFHRTGQGHTGCQCRKLDVYIPPPNAGKTGHRRRMKLQRVKEELRKRHLLPAAQTTREELELRLHDAVETEGCCSSQECPCVRNGIGCNADVCNCWYDSHQTKEGGKHDHAKVGVEEIQARCGNTNGMYAVDLNRIQQARQQILAKAIDGWVCPPVSQHTPPPPSSSSSLLANTRCG